jgi:hypothetical protein
MLGTAVRPARTVDRRAVAVPGGMLFAAGTLLLATVPADSHYVSHFLPAVMLTGAGIGLCLPAFGSAAVAELPRVVRTTQRLLSTLSALALGRIRARDVPQVAPAAPGPAVVDAIH